MKSLLVGLASLCLGVPTLASAERYPNAIPVVADYVIKGGGKDGGDCTKIGVWDGKTHTCTLTTDVYAGPSTYNVANAVISIEGNGVTIEGNGHSIIDANYVKAKNGIYIEGQSRITVQNINFKDCRVGVGIVYGSRGNTVRNITTTGSAYSVSIHESSGNIITDNVIDSSIWVTWYAKENEITYNTISRGYIYVSGWCTNNFVGYNTTSSQVFVDAPDLNTVVGNVVR